MMDFLKFPYRSNSLCLLYAVWGCITVLKDHTSWQTFMPLPANSLMKSARQVTAYVHIHFWISKYEYNSDESCTIAYRCHSLLAYWHTLRFVAVNEDGCVHSITAHFEENSEPMSHNIGMDSGNRLEPPLNDWRSERAPANINYYEFPTHFLVASMHTHCRNPAVHVQYWVQLSQITPVQWINLKLYFDVFPKPVPPLALCSHILDLPGWKV